MNKPFNKRLLSLLLGWNGLFAAARLQAHPNAGRYGDKLRTSRIVKYTFIILVVLSTLSTFTSIVIGVDNLVTLSFGEYFTYQLLPPSVLAIALYALMAKRDAAKAWSYGAIVFLLGSLSGILILSLIMQKLYSPPTWFIELPLSLASAMIGTLIGIKWGIKNATAV